MPDERRKEALTSALGTCPICAKGIPTRNLLIRYEDDDGWPKIFAECPACVSVVHPK